MDETIKDSIRQGRVGDLGEPLGDWHLGDDNGGGMAKAVVQHLQDILSIGWRKRIAHPIIQDQ